MPAVEYVGPSVDELRKVDALIGDSCFAGLAVSLGVDQNKFVCHNRCTVRSVGVVLLFAFLLFFTVDTHGRDGSGAEALERDFLVARDTASEFVGLDALDGVVHFFNETPLTVAEPRNEVLVGEYVRQVDFIGYVLSGKVEVVIYTVEDLFE